MQDLKMFKKNNKNFNRMMKIKNLKVFRKNKILKI